MLTEPSLVSTVCANGGIFPTTSIELSRSIGSGVSSGALRRGLPKPGIAADGQKPLFASIENAEAFVATVNENNPLVRFS
jgi:hypothetical protein